MQNIETLFTTEEGVLRQFQYEMNAPFEVAGLSFVYEDGQKRRHTLHFEAAMENDEDADAAIMIMDMGMAFDATKGDLVVIRHLCLNDHRRDRMILLYDDNRDALFRHFCENIVIPDQGLSVNFRS